MSRGTKCVNGISDIRRYFHRNETPIYFISATNFNLLGMDEWCKSFKFITYIDCFDGRHPNLFVPSEGAARGVPDASRTSTTTCSAQGGAGLHRRSHGTQAEGGVS